MFDTIAEHLERDRITRYQVTAAGAHLTYSQVLDLWCNEVAFRTYFTRLLAGSPFPAFRWETPGLTTTTADQPFEFVLLNSPGFASRPTDAATYREYFTDDDADQGIVTFANLRGDATLVVPSPRTSDGAYGHLAAFVRNAPAVQVDALWRVLGSTVRSQVTQDPIWLSTAGGGVAWLHMRLDSTPKYYGYSPYRAG